MPELPRLTLNSAPVYNRLVAAFHDDPEEYRTWLKQALSLEVLAREQRALMASHATIQKAKADELTALVQTEWPPEVVE